MISALVSGSSGPGSSPGRGHCVVFLGKTIYSHSASFHPTQVYEWVLVNFMVGVALRWTRIPSGKGRGRGPGSRNTRSRFMLQKPGKLRPEDHLARMQTLPSFFTIFLNVISKLKYERLIS